MAKLCVRWQTLSQDDGAPRARSSHAVAVVNNKAYVFGGEFEPRVPLDNTVYVFDLASRRWCVAEAKGDPPLPRVGVTMAAVGEIIYVFAGRDKEHEELGELYSFHTGTGEWKLLSEGGSDCGTKAPPPRSYHAMAADHKRKQLYIFGGCGKDGSIGACGKDGRFHDLWVYDIHSGKWSALPIFPQCVPRGGPGLVVAGDAVWVIFGFNGQELTDLFRYDIQERTWEQVVVEDETKPFGRSVFGAAAIGKYVLLYGGEVDPSDLGHLGAGSFTSEVIVLDTEELAWIRPPVENKDQASDPGARGWFAAASFENSMLVYGGNSETNDRLDDMYLLSLVEE